MMSLSITRTLGTAATVRCHGRQMLHCPRRVGGTVRAQVCNCSDMAIDTVNSSLLEQVRQLRSHGSSPKQVARALHLPPAKVRPLIRAVAEEDQARAAEADPTEAEVLGCWLSPGWSTGLRVRGHKDWPDTDFADDGRSGAVLALVARQGNGRKATVCSFMVDVYCLGVKDAFGPRTVPESELLNYRRMIFGVFPEPPVEVPLEAVRHLVFGGVDYARRLGFEPHDDFAAAAAYLGEWNGEADIEFGRDGKPLYIQGPRDNVGHVMATLTQSVGTENVHT